MDPLGVKRIIAIIEKSTGAVIPQTGALLSKMSNELDGIGVFVGRATDIADSIVETELVKDLDAAIESLPIEARAVAEKLRGVLDHFLRVGTRASNAAQETQALAADLRAFLAALRDGNIKFVTETKVEKEK